MNAIAKNTPDFEIKNLNPESWQTSPSDLVMLVDALNNPIKNEAGQMLGTVRSEVVDDKLWHRSSCIFITDEEGNFYVQKRAKGKLYYGGYYDLMTGGVMDL